MSVPMRPSDPAYFMLENGRREKAAGGERKWRSTPVVYDPDCYICTDEEFELMGLPLCRKCPMCVAAKRGDGHIPADDDTCDECGFNEGWHDRLRYIV